MTDLGRLYDEIRVSIGRLIEPGESVIEHDDGSTATYLVPSLLNQLRQAVYNGRDPHGRRSSGVAAPLNLDAVDLLQTVRSGAWDMATRWDYRGIIRIEDQLAHVQVEACRCAEPDTVSWVASTTAGWVKSIGGFLDPPRPLELVAPCPACGVRTVYRPDSSGEAVRVAALSLSPDGCICLACKYRWPQTHFRHLATVLGIKFEWDLSHSEEGG
ncbi:hypothetical protein GCM10012275_28480 [Longimycelium tulufanense]|uniref:Uncharacterized protein n=1 Tax=Longimycelium tulufanense TaxID=907463 RepID=A0A8J3FWS5_9PSEU|nr:hypothetical protein [Longimycelium tulufanense]GGM55649.1 hypothetical protein GCM10012275_28480 [Longimycelium tulufanense]